jgi:hypothetical protein
VSRRGVCARLAARRVPCRVGAQRCNKQSTRLSGTTDLICRLWINATDITMKSPTRSKRPHPTVTVAKIGFLATVLASVIAAAAAVVPSRTQTKGPDPADASKMNTVLFDHLDRWRNIETTFETLPLKELAISLRNLVEHGEEVADSKTKDGVLVVGASATILDERFAWREKILELGVRLPTSACAEVDRMARSAEGEGERLAAKSVVRPAEVALLAQLWVNVLAQETLVYAEAIQDQREREGALLTAQFGADAVARIRADWLQAQVPKSKLGGTGK